MTFVTSHFVLRHPILDASKNVQIPTVSEFDKIQHVRWISQDDSNGEIRFVIRDLKKIQVLTEITIFPFFKKLEFSRVLHSSRRPTLPSAPTKTYGLISVDLREKRKKNKKIKNLSLNELFVRPLSVQIDFIPFFNNNNNNNYYYYYLNK